MEIIYSIAHRIIKDKREKDAPVIPATIKYRESVFDSSSEKVILLVEALLKIYKTGKTFGSFDPDVDNHPFQSWLKTSDGSGYSEQVFIDISRKTIDRIKVYLDNQNFATGGYLIFVYYKVDHQLHFLIAMIKDKGGFTFTDDMDLKDTHHIDLDKLHQAARIDLSKLHAEEESYLSFLKGNSKQDIIGYFANALGCTDLIPSNITTQNVFQLIQTICSDADIPNETIKNITDNVHDFLKERHPESVKLEEIAVKLNANLPLELHDKFIEKANSDEFCISQEFVPNPTALRSFKRIDFKAATWNLSMNKNALGIPDSEAEIIFDSEEKSLTINNLPQKLMDELNIFLINSDE